MTKKDTYSGKMPGTRPIMSAVGGNSFVEVRLGVPYRCNLLLSSIEREGKLAGTSGIFPEK